MADRSYHKPETQGVRHVEYNFSVTLASGAPVFVEGDTAGSASGSYLTLTDAGTGRIGVATTDAFAAVVLALADVNLSTPTGDWKAVCTKPSQAANGKWSFEIRTYQNAAGTYTLTDVTAGDPVSCKLVLRNSSLKP